MRSKIFKRLVQLIPLAVAIYMMMHIHDLNSKRVILILDLISKREGCEKARLVQERALQLYLIQLDYAQDAAEECFPTFGDEQWGVPCLEI